MSSPCTVTVLVAVYNTAAYLPQCLDSLLGQRLQALQIICIDDASTDSSGALLDQYAARDERIEVVHLKQNQGQAHARNVGLQLARGRHICFLDSDDWMSPDCLEQAVSVFTAYPSTGCVLFRPIYYTDEAHQEDFPMKPFELLSGYDAFVSSLTWKIHGVYMTTASIHRRYPYDESAHGFSDDNTTRLHYLASEEVRCCEGVYYYRQRADSTSNAISLRRFDYLKANESMKQQLEAQHVSRDVLALYEDHRWINVVDLYLLYYSHRASFTAKERREALTTLRHAWATIDSSLLRPKLRWKLGYLPMQWSWTMFRIEEELYFGLKKLLGKL